MRSLAAWSGKSRDAVSAACAAYGQALRAAVPAGAMPASGDLARQAISEARNALLRAEEANRNMDRGARKYYSCCFPVCDRAAAQRGSRLGRGGYMVSPPSGRRGSGGEGCEAGGVVVPAGAGLVASAPC